MLLLRDYQGINKGLGEINVCDFHDYSGIATLLLTGLLRDYCGITT